MDSFIYVVLRRIWRAPCPNTLTDFGPRLKLPKPCCPRFRCSSTRAINLITDGWPYICFISKHTSNSPNRVSELDLSAIAAWQPQQLIICMETRAISTKVKLLEMNVVQLCAIHFKRLRLTHCGVSWWPVTSSEFLRAGFRCRKKNLWTRYLKTQTEGGGGHLLYCTL